LRFEVRDRPEPETVHLDALHHRETVVDGRTRWLCQERGKGFVGAGGLRVKAQRSTLRDRAVGCAHNIKDAPAGCYAPTSRWRSVPVSKKADT
jgi:hypothetical protein